MITTSAVVELSGGCIVTRSGSVYELGRTFDSESLAAELFGPRHSSAQRQLPQALPVIDLESDDLSGLGMFAHEHMGDDEG